MIEDLARKSNNEKYYKSIRYFSHFLKGSKRFEFISGVALHNIYLAAQCIMSCEKDKFLEDQLAQIALDEAMTDVINKKVIGFLGLIELNRYDLVFEAMLKIQKIDSAQRSAITQIIDELESEEIVKFLRIILAAKAKGLVNSVISNILRREVKFSNSQKKQLEEMITEIKALFGNDNRRLLKFIFAFDLPKKLIPQNLDSIAKKQIQKNLYEFIRSFYLHYEIPFPFSNVELCRMHLSRNKFTNVNSFKKIIFEIEDKDIQGQLLSEALLKGKYFSAFVISLIQSPKEREFALLRISNFEKVAPLVMRFLNEPHPLIDQEALLKIINITLGGHEVVLGKKVKCKVIAVIPKTIFVELNNSKVKGSIWIKEYTKDTSLNDARELVNIGDELDAVILGFHSPYLQLSVIRL